MVQRAKHKVGTSYPKFGRRFRVFYSTIQRTLEKKTIKIFARDKHVHDTLKISFKDLFHFLHSEMKGIHWFYTDKIEDWSLKVASK